VSDQALVESAMTITCDAMQDKRHVGYARCHRARKRAAAERTM